VFSRVYLGVHSVPDVAGGVILGLGFAPGYHFGLESCLDRLAGSGIDGPLQILAPVLLISAGVLCLALHPDPNPRSSTIDESAVCMGAMVSALLCVGRPAAEVPPKGVAQGAARALVGAALVVVVKIVVNKLLVLALRPVYKRLPPRKRPVSSGEAFLATQESPDSELVITRRNTPRTQNTISNWKKANKKTKAIVAMSHPYWHDMYETEAEEKLLGIAVKYLNYMAVGVAVFDACFRVFRLLGI